MVVSWPTKTRSVWFAFVSSRAVRRIAAALRRPTLTILRLIALVACLLGHPIPARFLYAKGAIVTFTPIKGRLRVGTGNADGHGKPEKWN